MRIDDIDYFRNTKSAADNILTTLEKYQLFWDGPVVRQTQRLAVYENAIDELNSLGLTYACRCTRKSLSQLYKSKPARGRYPGFCRNKTLDRAEPHALRIKTFDQDISFNDRVQGRKTQYLWKECGDFIVKRRDEIVAYHLATVLDDYYQNITEVVRGSDLLDSTARQIYLQRRLAIPQPEYCHIPILVDQAGSKLSKQTGAPAIGNSKRNKTLYSILCLLNQEPEPKLEEARVEDIIDWAVKYWDVSRLRGQALAKIAT